MHPGEISAATSFTARASDGTIQTDNENNDENNREDRQNV